MKKVKCPRCGSGVLEESDVYGFECPACGETFEYTDETNLNIVDSDKWVRILIQKSSEPIHCERRAQ